MCTYLALQRGRLLCSLRWQRRSCRACRDTADEMENGVGSHLQQQSTSEPTFSVPHSIAEYTVPIAPKLFAMLQLRVFMCLHEARNWSFVDKFEYFSSS
jgi:hypothetical protein